MTQSITVLEVIEIRDGYYGKVCVQRHFGKVDAICEAWRQHKDFLNSRNGDSFDKNDTFNYDDVEFGQFLGKRGMIMIENSDKSSCRIYSIITLNSDFDVRIED